MTQSYHTPEAIEVAFDDENLVANAGLLLVSTLASKLGLADVIADKVDLTGRVGGANPASKSLTLIHAMVAGASHIDHVDMLRAGSSSKLLPFRGGMLQSCVRTTSKASSDPVWVRLLTG